MFKSENVRNTVHCFKYPYLSLVILHSPLIVSYNEWHAQPGRLSHKINNQAFVQAELRKRAVISYCRPSIAGKR